MKKNIVKLFFTLLVAICLTFASVSIAYAEPSPSSPLRPEAPEITEVVVKNSDGTTVAINMDTDINVKSVSEAENTPGEATSTALVAAKDALNQVLGEDNHTTQKTSQDNLSKALSNLEINGNKYRPKDYDADAVFEVTVSDAIKQILSQGGTITIDFDYSNSNLPIVIHQNEETKEWIFVAENKVTKKGDGISVEFDSLCPVAFLQLSADAQPIRDITPLIIIIVIAVIIIAILLIIFLKKRKEKDSEDETVNNEEEKPAENEVVEDNEEEAPVEESVEETPVEEEAPVEEETPVEEVKEEEKPAEPVIIPTFRYEDDEEDIPIPEDVNPEDLIEEELDEFLSIEYNESYVAKLVLLDDELKESYNAITNLINSYKVSDRISWKYEKFTKNRNVFAKLEVRGKAICLYLAVDAEKYADIKKYQLKQGKKGFSVIKVRSPRKTKYALALLEDLLNEIGAVKKKNFKEVDFFEPYKSDTEKTLISKELIKIKVEKTNTENHRAHQVKMFKSTSVYNIHKHMSSKDALNLVGKSNRSVDETNFGIVYTDSLCEAFDGDEVITLDLIKEKVPEVDQTMTAYKLKPRGRMTKALTIDCDAFTLGAAKMVALTGGKLLSPSDKESEE